MKLTKNDYFVSVEANSIYSRIYKVYMLRGEKAAKIELHKIIDELSDGIIGLIAGKKRGEKAQVITDEWESKND